MAYKTYDGIAYRQTTATDAPWLVLFVAPAEELLTWAGIPRRTDTATMGFQRVDDVDRVARAKEFFSLPPNQSPTALVIGVHPPVDRSRRDVRLMFSNTPAGSGPFPCKLEVTTDPREMTIEEARQRVRSQILMRATPTSDDDEAVDEPPIENDEYATENDEASDEDDAIELSESLVGKLLENLDDPKWVAQNAETILDFAKPATVIDGQHRVKGAAACERGLPFAVCAMFDCPWPEQVFQFTVVNYAQRGIPDQFITANAALSLTELELEALQGRLTQARVKVIEYELMRIVQFDVRSPFFGLVNLSESKADETRIGYKTMVRVAKDWYAASLPVLKNDLLPNLFPDAKGRAGGKLRLQLWRDQHWGDFFIEFWRVVAQHYSAYEVDVGGNLWTVGKSNLTIAIVLYEFQRAFFRDLNAQDPEWFQVPVGEIPVPYLLKKVQSRASKFVSFFPPEFFAASWKIKSLNTSAGRTALEKALTSLHTSKGKYQYERSALFTGEIK